MKTMTLYAIIIGEKAKDPLHYVDSVRAVKGKGLEGDRYFYGRGTFNKPQLSQAVIRRIKSHIKLYVLYKVFQNH